MAKNNMSVLWSIGAITSAIPFGEVQCTSMDIRVGHGFDSHRLTSKESGGREMCIGGVKIGCEVGPIAHSDGDAVTHAVTDAILAAAGQPDLGTLFPNNVPENECRDSMEFLVEAVTRASEHGWAICNIDITVLCDACKIVTHKEQICNSLQKHIGAPVNIKGKTYEGTSSIEAIEVHAVALVQRGIHV